MPIPRPGRAYQDAAASLGRRPAARADPQASVPDAVWRG